MAMKLRSERGVSLVEAAMTIPMLLLIAVGIFEFGRAYQFWQVMTNAAREGARYSVTPTATEADTKALVVSYMKSGGLAACEASCVDVNRGLTLPTGTGSQITIAYPFEFIVLQPVANLIKGGPKANGNMSSLTMHATATMRNEAP
jgi:Flp pilus assembly protein TadG